MSFNNETSTLEITIPLSEISKFEGTQEITVTLEDEQGL
jgi:hypothetical protein